MEHSHTDKSSNYKKNSLTLWGAISTETCADIHHCLAMLLTIVFDLSRIASLGAIFYIIMDIVIHWGVFRYLRKEVKANAAILIAAILLDVIVLGVLLWVKAQSDMLAIWASLLGLVLIFGGTNFYKSEPRQGKNEVK